MNDTASMVRYVKIRGRVYGPYDVTRLRQMVTRGQLSRSQEISSDGVVWLPAASEPDLFEAEAGGRVRRTPGRETSGPAPLGEEPGRSQNRPSRDSLTGWYHGAAHLPVGPVTTMQLIDLVSGGKLTGASLVWRQGMSDWKSMEETPEFRYLFPIDRPVDHTTPAPIPLPTDATLNAIVGELVYHATKPLPNLNAVWIGALFYSFLFALAGCLLMMQGVLAESWRGIGTGAMFLGIAGGAFALAWFTGAYRKRIIDCRRHSSLLGLLVAHRALRKVWVCLSIAIGVSLPLVLAFLAWRLVDPASLTRLVSGQ